MVSMPCSINEEPLRFRQASAEVEAQRRIQQAAQFHIQRFFRRAIRTRNRELAPNYSDQPAPATR